MYDGKFLGGSGAEAPRQRRIRLYEGSREGRRAVWPPTRGRKEGEGMEMDLKSGLARLLVGYSLYPHTESLSG